MVICWPMFFESTCFYHIVSGHFSKKLLLCSIPGSGRSPGGGNGNPPQCSYLGSPMNRVALQATVHGVAKSWTWLRDWVCACACVCAHMHTHTLSSVSAPGAGGSARVHFKSHSSIHAVLWVSWAWPPLFLKARYYQGLVSQVLVLKVGLPSVAFEPFGPQLWVLSSLLIMSHCAKSRVYS